MLFLSGFTILWIGLTDVVNQNKYVYPSSGRKPLYTNWDRGQPEIGKKRGLCSASNGRQQKVARLSL